MGLALVTRMPSWVEAQIAAGALRSAGIAAEVFDGNFGQIEAPVIESLGGFRIMAPEEAGFTSDCCQVSLKFAQLGERRTQAAPQYFPGHRPGHMDAP